MGPVCRRWPAGSKKVLKIDIGVSNCPHKNTGPVFPRCRRKGSPMLNVTSPSAVSWPAPASVAVAPVHPVASVPSVQTGGQDGKTQMGFGRDDRAAPQRAAAGRSTVDERGAPVEGAGTPASGTPAPHDMVAHRQARQEAARAAENKQAGDKKAVEHLQNVLSRMWEASAAVVDRALGIEPAASSEVPGTQSDTAPDLSSVAASTIPRKPVVAERQPKPALEPLPWPVMPESSEVEIDVVGDGIVPGEDTAAEVVAYDEYGHGSAAPVEAGAIISERV